MDIKKEIKEAIFQNKKIFIALIVIFTIAIIIGAIVSDEISPILMPILTEAILEGDESIIDAFSIMKHNEISALMIMIGSIFFGIYAVFSIFLNGFVIGFTAGITVHSINDLIIYLSLIVPHGILEIPAFFFNCTSGILLFLFIFRVIKDKIHKNSFRQAYENNKITLRHTVILFILAVVLFAIAALIEGFITPYVGNITIQQIGNGTVF